jgi:hypothetical protein
MSSTIRIAVMLRSVAQRRVSKHRALAAILRDARRRAPQDDESSSVIRGLDPRIHHSKKMDHRVKPGDDDY